MVIFAWKNVCLLNYVYLSLSRSHKEFPMKHVMIDLYGCDPQLLADASLLQYVLEEYPNRVGMQKVSPVFLKDIKTSCPLDDGLSGFVIIATSHISLHAWPYYGMVNIDVFSCEDFQTTTVGDFAMALFQTTQIEIHEVERALQSPRGVVQALHPSEIEMLAIRAPVHPSGEKRTTF
jgi:S-adenosylmethionine decarboxylase